MKILKLTFFALALLSLGIWIGVSIRDFKEKADPQQKAKWMLYNGGFRGAVIEGVEKFREKTNRWPKDIAEVVAAGFLPQESEIYIPVYLYNTDLSGGLYRDHDFVTNSVTGMKSDVRNAPYLLIPEGENLIIRIKADKSGIKFEDAVLVPKK